MTSAPVIGFGRFWTQPACLLGVILSEPAGLFGNLNQLGFPQEPVEDRCRGEAFSISLPNLTAAGCWS